MSNDVRVCRWCEELTGSKSRTCKKPGCQLQFGKFKTPVTFQGAIILKERIEQLIGMGVRVNAESAIET